VQPRCHPPKRSAMNEADVWTSSTLYANSGNPSRHAASTMSKKNSASTSSLRAGTHPPRPHPGKKPAANRLRSNQLIEHSCARTGYHSTPELSTTRKLSARRSRPPIAELFLRTDFVEYADISIGRQQNSAITFAPASLVSYADSQRRCRSLTHLLSGICDLQAHMG
jgi:hypothetical protein